MTVWEMGLDGREDRRSVGVGGTGRLNISGGASVVNNSAVLGVAVPLPVTVVGLVNVDGSPSQWTVQQDFTVGGLGDGTLNITGGGKTYVGQIPSTSSNATYIGKNLGLGTKGMLASTAMVSF